MLISSANHYAPAGYARQVGQFCAFPAPGRTPPEVRAGSFKLPGAVTDVIGGESLGYGDVLEMGAWDVRVLVEADA